MQPFSDPYQVLTAVPRFERIPAPGTSRPNRGSSSSSVALDVVSRSTRSDFSLAISASLPEEMRDVTTIVVEHSEHGTFGHVEIGGNGHGRSLDPDVRRRAADELTQCDHFIPLYA